MYKEMHGGNVCNVSKRIFQQKGNKTNMKLC